MTLKLPAVSGSSGRLVIERLADDEEPQYPGRVFEDQARDYAAAIIGDGIGIVRKQSVYTRSFDVFAIPAMRMVADMSEGGGLRMVIPPGQSGIPASSHFADQAELWQQLGDLEIVTPAPHAAATLILEPAP